VLLTGKAGPVCSFSGAFYHRPAIRFWARAIIVGRQRMAIWRIFAQLE
jgi:hypothetical protein